MKRVAVATSSLLLWLHLQAGATIPSPQQILGFSVGQERRLADWKQIIDYFRRLDQRSDRVTVEELGRTTLGNPFVVAVISSPKTLRQLETYQQIQQGLADPRQMMGGPHKLIERGKTIILVTCAIHPTEAASAQMSMELAYDLARLKDEQTGEILENVILLLVPSLNPDGVDIVNHWYWKTLGTAAEGTAPPQLYHRYVGHDLNRDWYMFTQKKTRLAVEKIHNRWHPQIVVDLHEMRADGARIFVPPYTDPIDPNVDPILQGKIIELGSALFPTLISSGRRGVLTNAVYDAYTPARAYPHYHGGVRILCEVARAKLATPLKIDFEALRSGRDYNPRVSSWNFPVPWKGGEWHPRDIVDYQKATLRAVLTHGARHRRSWLRNFYQVGVNSIARQHPYAFVIPADQRDPQSLHDLLRVLELGLVEVHVAREPFQVAAAQQVSPPWGERQRQMFPAGSLVILMQQPYSSFAKTLLEVQQYPEEREFPGGPLKRPYDVAAHTLGIQLGVETYQVDTSFKASLSRSSSLREPSGRLMGEGDYWLYSHANNAFARLTNRLLKQGFRVRWAPNGFRISGLSFPAGTLLAQGSSDKEGMELLLKDTPVVVNRVRKRPQLAWQQIRQPRIGLYRSQVPSMDEGWTRWILKEYEFNYEPLFDQEIRSGDLSGYDIIVIPDQDDGPGLQNQPSRTVASLKNGLGDPYPQAYQGGLGAEGLDRLKSFAETGGTLLFLGNATALPLSEWDFKARNAMLGLSREEFDIPGSLLRITVNNRHPLGYGMTSEAAAMFKGNPAFDLGEGLGVALYPPEDLLLSGWAAGEEFLSGKAALAELRLGKGRLILVGFRCQFRAQVRGTYKFLFNSLYYATVAR